jgi:hypothetical protein
MQRALTMLNESGDTTISWRPENDDKMLEIIERKMAAGVIFYIIAKRTPGQRGRVASPKPLKNAADAMKHRALAIKDADFSKFVLDGFGDAVPTPSEPAQTVKRAKTPREVATGHSVGVQPRRGG